MEKQDIRKSLGGWEAGAYRAVREGCVHEFSRDGQFFASAMCAKRGELRKAIKAERQLRDGSNDLTPDRDGRCSTR